MSDSDSDEPLQINMGSDNSDNDENMQVHIKFADSDDSDDESNSQPHHTPSQDNQQSNQPDQDTTQAATTTPDQTPAQPESQQAGPSDTTPQSGATPSTEEPEPWDDAMLDQIQGRARVSVDVGDQKLLKLRQQHEQKAASATAAAQVHAPKPDRRLNPSKREEKREQSLHEQTPLTPTAATTPGGSSAPSQPVAGPRRKYITQTLVHIDLSMIKTLEDIEEAVSRLTPDPSPYEGIVVLPPTKPIDAPAATDKSKPDDDNGTKTDDDVNKDEGSSVTPVDATPAVVAPITAVAVPADPQPVQKTAKELAAEKKKQEEEAKKQAEADKKAKKDEELRKKQEEKDRKKEEDLRKKEDEKRKKEEEKRKKEEEKLANKNKGKNTPQTAVVGNPPVSTPENSTNTNSTSEQPVGTDENQPENSISRNSMSETSTSRDPNSLGGPNAACSLNYHDPAFPQPITFEQATIILKSQQPYKISSKYQKANVFGTSGFRKPEHRTCYFYQHLWDTDFDPTNRAHVLLLDAFYMYMNDLVITPMYNKDPASKGSQRPAKCEVPELTGNTWVETLRASDPANPAAELLGVPARYTILRPLECDLRPSILTLYLALYLLQGCTDQSFKNLIIALLRQFFLRDNSPSNMSYLELFTPFSYVINSLILSNTTVHAEPFYRTFYRYNLKKDLGQWILNDDYTLNGFILSITQYLALLTFTFWFRHLIQQYDYPTLVCAVRQRLLTNIKGEFERIDSEYCRGGYAAYISEVNNDNYLAQDLKVVFADQKKLKHLLTPLEAQMHMNQQQRGPGRNSISYSAPAPTPVNTDDPKQNKIGPNIVVGKTQAQINDGPGQTTTTPGTEQGQTTTTPATEPAQSTPATETTPAAQPDSSEPASPKRLGPPPLRPPNMAKLEQIRRESSTESPKAASSNTEFKQPNAAENNAEAQPEDKQAEPQEDEKQSEEKQAEEPKQEQEEEEEKSVESKKAPTADKPKKSPPPPRKQPVATSAE